MTERVIKRRKKRPFARRDINIHEKEIGRKFGPDDKYEVLEVLPFVEGELGRKFKIKCHECAKDKELYGDAEFIVRKEVFTKRGRVRCGCSNYIHSREQSTILCKRASEKKNYTFLGFVGDGPHSVRVKVKLMCNLHGNVWETTSVDQLLDIDRGACHICAAEKHSASTTKTDEYYVEQFMSTGKFLEGTIFTRNNGISDKGHVKSEFDYYCPVCSEDEYVKAGVCSGVFHGNAEGLKQGWLSCRHGPNAMLNDEQLKYFVGNVAKNKFKLLEVIPKETSEDYVRLECMNGHVFDTRRSYARGGNARCPHCKKLTKGGFDRSRDAFLYVLEVSSEHDSFTGYGITNDIGERMRRHKRHIREAGFFIDDFKVFDLYGDIAYKIEREIISNFDRNPQDIEGFKIEATYYHQFSKVVEFVNERANYFDDLKRLPISLPTSQVWEEGKNTQVCHM